MDLKRILLLRPCANKEELKNWLLTFLEFDIFDTTTSRFATSNPLDAMWDSYSHMMYPNSRAPKTYLFAAARSTQKTISIGAFNVLQAIHGRRSLVHFAGSKDQVDAGYSYIKKFFQMPYLKDLVDGEVTQTGIDLRVPSWDDPIWLSGGTCKDLIEQKSETVRFVEILVKPITPQTVQGLHMQTTLDELHTLRGEKRQAYKDIRKIPVASWDGKPWVRVGISSRKNPNSVVEEEIENKEKTGLIVKQWTVFEGVEQCTPDRNGGDFVHERQVNIYTGDIKEQKDFDGYQGKDKDKYVKATFASKCFSCPLQSVCLGDLAKPKPHNSHYQSIEAAITDFVSDSDRNWYIAQCLSLQPSREGIVFSRFDEAEFSKTPRQIYEIFIGEDPGADISEEQLIDIMVSKGVKRYAGLDHGFTDPTAITVFFEDSIGTVYMMKSIAVSGLDPNQVVDLVRDVVSKYQITHLYPDTAAPAINLLIKKAKIIRVIDDFSKKDGIQDGITYMRNKISPIIGGDTKLFGLKGNCEGFIAEIKKYSYSTNSAGKFTDEPEDGNDHELDATRYAALNRWAPKSRMAIGKDIPVATDQEELKKLQNAETAKQNENWLKREIDKSIGGDQTAQMGAKKSKGGGFFWGI